MRMSALLQWLPLAGAGLVLIALRLTGRRLAAPALGAGAFVALALAVLVADLFRANMGFNPAIPSDHARSRSPGAIRYLQSRTPNRFVGLDSCRREPAAAARPGDALRALRRARLRLPGRAPLRHALARDGRPTRDFIQPTTRAPSRRRALRALSLLSVSDLLQDPAASRCACRACASPTTAPTRASTATSTRCRARSSSSASAPSPATTRRSPRSRDPASTPAAWRSPSVVAGLPQETGGPRRRAGAARALRATSAWSPARRATRRSLLVLTDVHFPGWKATVDGRDAPVERVDYLLRGVVVPPASTRSSCATSRPAGGSAGSSASLARSSAWRRGGDRPGAQAEGAGAERGPGCAAPGPRPR